MHVLGVPKKSNVNKGWVGRGGVGLHSLQTSSHDTQGWTGLGQQNLFPLAYEG